MKSARKLAVAAIAAAVATALASCGGGMPSDNGHEGTHPRTSTNAPSDGGHNEADVAFAQGMIPHHAQAIDMARMAASRAGSPEVKALARQIEAAQDPEIATMTGWLNDWGAALPRTGAPDMGHGHHGMQGMMSSEEMRRMTQATGAEFDRMFLTMMIKHHEGAIIMARNELSAGSAPAAKKLAQRIIDSQQTEIRTMRDLLSQG